MIVFSLYPRNWGLNITLALSFSQNSNHTQLSQWINPKDKRHLRAYTENIAAILQSKSGCLIGVLTK